jgi:hypothetical protein
MIGNGEDDVRKNGNRCGSESTVQRLEVAVRASRHEIHWPLSGATTKQTVSEVIAKAVAWKTRSTNAMIALWPATFSRKSLLNLNVPLMYLD